MYILLRNKIRVVRTNNLSDIDLGQYFTHGEKGLCITATKSLRHTSAEIPGVTVIDWLEMQESLENHTRQENCLRESEQRYILYKTIEELTDEKRKQVFHNSINGLHELFASLFLAEVDHTKLETHKIFATQPASTSDIFRLYVRFYKNFLKEKKLSFQMALRNGIQEMVEKYDQIVFMGFSFFNDLQSAFFSETVKAQKLSAAIISNEQFILDDWLFPLLVANDLYVELEEHNSDKTNKFDELREKLFDTTPLSTEIGSSISIMEPAANRESEFRYVVERIVERLEKCKTRKEVEKECAKIAVILTHESTKNTQLLNHILRTRGIFISGSGKIYTSRDQYMLEPSKLTYPQKIRAFNKFTRLEAYIKSHSLFKTPLGKYIQEIYKIASNGMNAESFNVLLTTNWFFADKNTKGIISEFNRIKEFFATRQTTDEWLGQIDEIMSIKSQIQNDDVYASHPFVAVEQESLEHFKKYISFVHQVIKEIQKIRGNIAAHLLALVGAMKSAGVDVESDLLLVFGNAVSQATGMNIDHAYFAKNFQSLVSDYITEKVEKNKNINLNVNNLFVANKYEVVFMPMFEDDKYPNAQPYDFPFTKSMVSVLRNTDLVQGYTVPVNYDDAYTHSFARHKFENLFKIATEEIIFTRAESDNGMPKAISIYGEDLIRKTSIKQTKIGDEYRPKIDKPPTRITRKAKVKNVFLNELVMKEVCPKQFFCTQCHLNKVAHTDKFTLTFYARAIIFNRFFTGIADGESLSFESLNGIIEQNLATVCDNVFGKMPLFDENEKNDLRITVRRQVYDFIKRNFGTEKFKPIENKFKLTIGNERKTKHNGVTARTRKNLVMTDLVTGKTQEFDISKGLDLLVSSSRGYKSKNTNYKTLLEEMRRPWANKMDRMGAANLLSFKLNTQFASRFIDQGSDNGIERVQNLIDDLGAFEYGNLDYVNSGACASCIIKEICMGGVDNE